MPREPKPTVDFLVALNLRLAREIRYLIRMEPGVQTPEETLEKASGSCRDSGWLLVQLLRHLGLAARFVSGYLIQLKPDAKPLEGPAGTDVDFTDLHAWCEVYLPGAGWIGLDPTSGLLAGESHIPLACTPEPASAAPVTGDAEKCETTFAHAMSVVRVWEAPRVTKPYSDAQWTCIEELGHRIDEDLTARDVRLTMGGEPTFVSIDDHDGAEWNTDALGPASGCSARACLRSSRRAMRPRACCTTGRESGTRASSCRAGRSAASGARTASRCGTRPRCSPTKAWTTARREAQAALFLATLATKLGLDPKYVFPAYEDTWYYLWRERRLPVNVDPFDSSLDDRLERARLGRCSARVWTRSPDTCCRWHALTHRACAGKAAPGFCATNAVT